MRARTIIRNEEKLKELEMKGKEIKFTKDSSGKIKASPSRTMQIRIKIKRGALKTNCQEDHEEITCYNVDPDKIYCTNGGELEGVSCAKCRRLFVVKKGSDMVVPAIKFLI